MDKVIEAIGEKVTKEQNVVAVLDGSVDPSKIIGYTIIYDHGETWSPTPKDSLQFMILPSTTEERDLFSSGKVKDGRGRIGTIYSKLVPVIRKGEEGQLQKTLYLEEALIVKEVDADHFDTTTPIDGEKYLENNPSELISDLQEDISQLIEGGSCGDFTDHWKYLEKVIDPNSSELSKKSTQYDRRMGVPIDIIDNLLPPSSYRDSDFPDIFPPFNNQFELRFRSLVKIKEQIKAKIIDADLYHVDNPDQMRKIISKLESLEEKIYKYQDQSEEKICREAVSWSKQIVSAENNLDPSLPARDSETQIDLLIRAQRNLRTILNIADSEFPIRDPEDSSIHAISLDEVELQRLSPEEFRKFKSRENSKRSWSRY